MFRTARMKRLTAVVMKEKKDPVLRTLKERGLVQFTAVHELTGYDILAVSDAKPTWTRARASDLISRIEHILEIFDTDMEVVPEPTEEIPPDKLFKKAEEEIDFLEGRLAEVLPDLEGTVERLDGIQEARAYLSILEKLGIDPCNMAGRQRVSVDIAEVHEEEVGPIRAELDKLPGDLVFHWAPTGQGKAAIVTIAFKELHHDIARIIRGQGHGLLKFPPELARYDIKGAYRYLESKEGGLENRRLRLMNTIRKMAASEYPGLLVLRERLQIERTLDEANTFFGRTDSVMVISGWVPAEYSDLAKEVIEGESHGLSIVGIEDPRKGETPPTLMVNPRQVKPVELITTNYGPPSYDEMDPTMVIALTFPLVFGFMFGDVGHGIMLMLAGYLLGFRLGVSGSLRRLGRVLLPCGFFAFLVGFLYGSTFGIEGIPHPLWESPMEAANHNIFPFLEFVMRLGLGLIVLGCLMNMGNELHHRNYLAVLASPHALAGIILATGIYNLLIGLMAGKEISYLVGRWYVNRLILAGFVLAVIGERFGEDLPWPMAVFESVLSIIHFVSNTLSYIRVLAIAVIHGTLSLIMMDAIHATGSLAIKAAVFVLGNLFIFALEAFVSFIHTLRLHYYEWFSKFYDGKGVLFIPFRVIRRYTTLVA
jgi:V/A-type H+-transporting ATPase subunit I